MIYHGARHHKGSRNSRSRSKSAHNQGRNPEYKDIRRNSSDEDGKVCAKCGEFRPYSDYYKYTTYSNDGPDRYHAKCKPCAIEDSKAQKAKRTSRFDILVDSYRAERARPHEPIPLDTLLARNRHNWASLNWSQQDHGDLKTLCMASVPAEKAADVMGRTPYALAYRAQTLRLPLPPDWAKLLAPKTFHIRKPPRFILKYPYLAKARPSDAELLRVNALVPHSFPDWVRADICQSVMLAFYEGDVSIAELEANKDDLRWFYKKYYREQSPREEVQISGGNDDDRAYEEIAESRRYYQTLERIEGARQIDYVWERERTAARFVMAGKVSNLKDVDDMLESGEIKIADLKPQLFRPWDRIRKHARARLKERFGIELSRDQAEKLVSFCQQRQADNRDEQRELHIFRSGRLELPVIYDRRVNEIISILPEGGGLGGMPPTVRITSG